MTHGSQSSYGFAGRPASTVDVPEFIDLFLDRVVARDAESISLLWDVPALVLGDQHVHGPMSLRQVGQLFADAFHQVDGRSDARPLIGAEHIESTEWVSTRVVLVELPWPARALGGFLQGVDATTFALRVDQYHHLKIRALLLRGHGCGEHGCGEHDVAGPEGMAPRPVR